MLRKAGTLLCAINLGGIAPGDVNSVDVIERICGDDVLSVLTEDSFVALFFFVVILLLTEVMEEEPESEELAVENKFVEGDPEEVDEDEE